MTRIRYITVEMRPAFMRRFDTPTFVQVDIKVRTELEEYSLSEILPEDDFTRRFDWYIDRAKKEILYKIKPPE